MKKKLKHTQNITRSVFERSKTQYSLHYTAAKREECNEITENDSFEILFGYVTYSLIVFTNNSH